MAKAKTPPRSNQASLVARPPPPSGIAPLPASPSMDDSLSAAVAAAKKKKKKGKGKKADDELGNGNLLPQPLSNTPYSATAQAQADLLATASDLYRRIEADPQGIPDDDAYWTSLPSHLRTFIRNALPIGQLPPSARNDSDDPNGRHASTQAMIAVAQQLAQAAHASQRHLQQHPPSGNANFQNTNNVAYPPFPFDPSVFADIALQTEQILPLHPHPNGADYRYSNANPPPTQPPGEPLPAPVVLVNEFDDEQGEFDDDYYSDDDMDPQEATTLDSRDGTWSNDMNGSHPNGLVAKTQSAAAKKKNKKKKKKGGTEGVNTIAPPTTAPLAPPPNPPRTTAALPPTQAPFTNTPSTGTRTAAQSLPPSSRAAGKQPMTFNAAGGKAPVNTRPTNGHSHNHGPVSNAVGKRPASTAASSHEQGSVNGAQSTTRAWSSSSVEERERIKEFWLGLNERERKNLIKIEKDGVLRKMKEQQKHGCSCAVCGRKRSSIEDELEVLYDAYYDELEQYASDQQKYVESGGQVPPPPGPGPFPGSVALDSQGAVIGGNALTKPPSKRQHQHTHPPPISRTKAALPPEDDEAYDEELEDDDYEDEYEYEDEEDDEEELEEPEIKPSQRRRPETGPPRANANSKASNDVFNFGSSLTVKGGILTVADDLLKNDGQKFLEMMEQLAERRALREEEVQAELDNASEEEELEEDEEEEDEDEAEDALTDEQRMEEGRRMFQIFAARMFEQRVLQAYRERVAQERQLQLLRELEEEDNAEKEREAKKAKENQKKKDKKKQAKQQKEEERIKLEEAKAAEEAAAKAKIERQREAELKKQDEIRSKREAEKRQKDEEKARKEEERRRRQEEEKSRELEKERKKREKEEKIRAEREAKEAKEREAREAKAMEEEERKAKEQQQQLERQEKARLAKEEQTKAETEKLQKEQQAREAAAAVTVRQPSPEVPAAKSVPVAAPAALSRSPASSPVARKVTANLPPSSPAQLRPSAPLPASAAPLPRGAGVARPALPSQAIASPSTLPAPPQGLPARPSTVSHAPTASPSILAGGSFLPRPPIQAPTSSIGSPARQGTPSNSASSPASNLIKTVPPTLASAPLLSSGAVGSGSSFVKSNVGSTVAPLSHQSSQPHGRYPMMAFGSSGSGSTPTRSPPAVMSSNGFMSGSNGKSAFDTVLGSPSSVNATTAGLASLNMGSANPSSQMPIGPIGGGMPSSSNAASTGPLHSRNPSMSASSAMDDYGRQTGVNSGSSRLLSRTAPGPIGPIGQQRRDMSLDELAPGGITSSIFGSNPLPERILGSSALGGDDELVEPQPRRTSHHTAPMSNSLFGTGAFGVTSPWASTFAGSGAAGSGSGSSTIPRTPSTPTASMLHGALGTGLTSTNGVTGSSALGSIHQAGQSTIQPPLTAGVDPWARASTGWDRARFAFEQPAAGQQHQQQQQQPSAQSSFSQQQQQAQLPMGASPLSPFGTQSQHQLRGMFGAPGQASQMSPQRHTTDRSGL